MGVLDRPAMPGKATHYARGGAGETDVHETWMVEQAFDRGNERAELKLVTS